MNVSLAPEAIYHLGHLTITNSILTGWLISGFLLLVAVLVGPRLQKIPGRLQNILEMVYDWLWNTAEGIIGRKDVTAEVFPYIITLFLFVLISNWSGLIPGVGSIGIHGVHNGEEALIPLFRAPTSDLNTVAVLAVFSMGYVQFLGLKHAGVKPYLKKFFNFQSPIGFFVGILEFIGEFVRVISFTFRLFGNVFAGEVLIGVMLFLTITLLPYVAIIPLPFFLLEILVGVIQAFIFCFLTIIFISLAIESHDESGHTHGGEELHLAEKAAESELAIEHSLIKHKPNRSHL